MVTVRKRENESTEDLLRRFRSQVARNNVIGDMKKHEFFIKPGDIRREKEKAAIARIRKANRNQF